MLTVDYKPWCLPKDTWALGTRFTFRAEKRNNNEPKFGGIFVVRLNKKVTNFVCFLNIPGKQ